MQLDKLGFDRIGHGQLVDGDISLLSDSMHSVDCLVFNGGIPPEVHQYDMVCTHQVQSFAHCLVGSQQDALVVILLELSDSLLPLVFVAPTIDSSLLVLDVIFLEGLFDHV